MSVAARLEEGIKAQGVAVTSVIVGVHGVAASVTVEPANLQVAAQPIIDAFDWSDAAELAWQASKQPHRSALKSAYNNALADMDADETSLDNAIAAANPANLTAAWVVIKVLFGIVKRIIIRQRFMARALREIINGG